MKNSVSHILFLLTSIFSFGQVTVEADTDLKEVPLNRDLNLIVVLNIIGEEYVQESQLMLPDLSKFEILGTASQQFTNIDPVKGIRANQLIFRALIQTKKAGKIKIGSALVKVNGKMYKSDPFEINVIDTQASVAPKAVSPERDVSLALELKDKTVYENQPTLAVLRVYSKNLDVFRKVHNVQLPNQKDVRMHLVSNAKQKIVQPRSADEPSSQVIATYLIIAEKSGNIELRPLVAKMKSADGGKISSNRLRLNVRKMPAAAPSGFNGAVGNFQLEVVQKDPDVTVEVNKPMYVQVKLSGKGNIDKSLVPQLIESTDYQYFKPKVVENVVPRKDGLSGTVTYDYVIIPKKSGKIDLKTASFSYYNPKEQKYQSPGSQHLFLVALTPQQIEDQKSTVTKVLENTNTVLETVQLPEIVQESNRKQIQQGINWQNVILNLVIMGGILVIVLGVNRFRRRKSATGTPVSKPITSVTDVENDLRFKYQADVQSTLDYMQRLLQQKNYSKFFASYAEMELEIENKVREQYNQSFKKYLENTKGDSFVEEHRLLQRQMNIEKFSPVHDEDHLSEVFRKIRKVFSEIAL